MIYDNDNDTLQATLNTMLDTLNKTVQNSYRDLELFSRGPTLH